MQKIVQNSLALKLKILKIIRILRKATKKMVPPMVPVIVEKFGKDPFLILISCLLSLRTRDTVTLPICIKLFSLAKTPQEFLKMPTKKLEEIIKPINFYKTKARTIQLACKEIIEKFHGKVPANEEDLLSLKGVGRKTTNLVLGEAFNIPALYVDTHVNRISNRLGIIRTTTVLDTELELKKIIPKKYWNEWSRLLVTWGQNVCVPIAPFVSKCPISHLCKKVGVINRR